MHIFKTKPEPLYLEHKHIEIKALAESSKRKQSDSWAEIINEYVLENDIKETSIQEIWVNCLGGRVLDFGKSEQMRISNILQFELYWDKHNNRYLRGVI